MDPVDLLIEPRLSCNKLSYSLRDDRLSQVINSMYKFFNPIISNGDLIIDIIRYPSRYTYIYNF